ncbi:SEC-C metal-binding domain-containing protein [Candidatus Mycobacterium methanotrophicum]|uniref:SEC-C metal-binding domain-containing protein n=1 Tax=Candidatus Mycobacterium methanotrophicum TaxID=2943498 RepID=A0ABY4QQ58_9MYCO|nr:SEC-C metal-binding domain-containing protein [Candidatus Mycobacterium methanotrophicum]UQX12090.1 SEC-C metal-binding domain-containing protein [Candidatus Mycobacterium methanotrophicum]
MESATEYQALERWEDALAAADAAVDAGLQTTPDPRCLRAEILMQAGRAAEAEPIWAAVLADTPHDVWLYNNAGFEYAHAGDHDTALRWLTDGLRLALRTGDPERLVDQLADLRQVSLDNLGRPADPDLTAWSPGRNHSCWCGSGRKYKKCCAAASYVDTESSR